MAAAGILANCQLRIRVSLPDSKYILAGALSMSGCTSCRISFCCVVTKMLLSWWFAVACTTEPSDDSPRFPIVHAAPIHISQRNAQMQLTNFHRGIPAMCTVYMPMRKSTSIGKQLNAFGIGWLGCSHNQVCVFNSFGSVLLALFLFLQKMQVQLVVTPSNYSCEYLEIFMGFCIIKPHH